MQACFHRTGDLIRGLEVVKLGDGLTFTRLKRQFLHPVVDFL